MATPHQTMRHEYKKGDKVTITRRNGETINGTVNSMEMNLCTFEMQYDVDYLKDGKIITMMCVPQTALTPNA